MCDLDPLSMFSLLEHCNPDHLLHIKVQYLFWCTEVNLLHNYTNIAVADLRTLNFNYIQYYCDILLYYCDSGKI